MKAVTALHHTSKSRNAQYAALAIAAQGPLLAYMSNLGSIGYILLLCLSLALARFAYTQLTKKRSPNHFHYWLMLAYGNLGMLIGWLIDFDCLPLLREGICLCGCANSPLGQGAFCHCPYMYLGMYLGSLPCLFRKQSNKLTICPQALLGCLGMGPGMMLGSYLLTFWPITNPLLHFFLTVSAMITGMFLGMALVEKIAQLFGSRAKTRIQCRT